MKRYALCVMVLSAALIAGCGSGGSETSGDGGVSGDGDATKLTTTVTFAFNDFTGVSVVGPFLVSIVPGPYSIQVTVDSGGPRYRFSRRRHTGPPGSWRFGQPSLCHRANINALLHT